jgi:uncharacterized membrane protein YuzA (DUF378 family)
MHEMSYEKLFWMTRFRMLLLILVIIGAYNWAAVAFDYNFVELLSSKVNPSGSLHITKVIYIIVAVSAFLLAIRKDTWLPFLGWTVIPSSLVQLKSPPENADIKIKVNVKPNSKVMYWAAYGKGHSDQNVVDAYKDYSNSGVVMSDSNGVVELSIVEGGPYHVQYKNLKRHIHYRVFGKLGGMLGPVKTIYY